LSLSLRERSAASFAHYALAQLRLKKGDKTYMESRLDGHFMNVFGWDPDLKLQFLVEGPSERVAELGKWMTAQFSYFEADLKSMHVLSLPAVVNTHQIGLIDLTGNDSEPVKDLSQSQAYLEDVALQTLRAVQRPTVIKLLTADPEPVFDVLEALEYASAFTLKIEPRFAEKLAKTVENFVPERDLPTPEWHRRYQLRGMRMFYYSTDFDHLRELLTTIDPKKRLAVFHDEFKGLGRKLSMGYLLYKTLLPARPLGRGIGPTAATLNLKVFSHGTEQLWKFASIFRSLKGKPLAFVSGGLQHMDGAGPGFYKDSGEWAKNGPGFYLWGKPDGGYGVEGDFGYSINAKVNPAARVVSDFNLTSRLGDMPDERRVFNASMLTFVDDTNGGDARQVFNRLFQSVRELGTHNYVFLGIQIRRAIADLSVDPGKRADVDSVMRTWLKKAPQFISSDELRVVNIYAQLPHNATTKEVHDFVAQHELIVLRIISTKRQIEPLLGPKTLVPSFF